MVLIGERRRCGGHVKLLLLSNESVLVGNLSHYTPTKILIFRFWKNSGGFERKEHCVDNKKRSVTWMFGCGFGISHVADKINPLYMFSVNFFFSPPFCRIKTWDFVEHKECGGAN